MAVLMVPEADNVYRLEMSGLLRKADLDRSQVELAAEMHRVGSVRLLCVLQDFQGWEPHSGWNDLTFYVKHGGAIDRIAIVGDEQWRTEALMFAAAGLRRGPVQYFTDSELAAARTWLAA